MIDGWKTACRRPERRGAAVIVLIAVFAVTMALCAAWVKRVVSERQHLKLIEERMQARWLAEAGVRRAAARLAVDDAYNGEEWLIPAEELDRPHGAAVEIRVEASDSPLGRLKLVARARYPADRARVRVTKRVLFSPGTLE